MNAAVGLLLAVLLVSGTVPECLAAPKEQGAKCPVIYPDRIWLRGFSVQPPVGDHWCQDGPNIFRSSVHVGWRERGWGDPSGPENRTHTFFLFANLDDVDGGVPKSIAELMSFAQKWINAGAIESAQLSGKGRLVLNAAKYTPRLTLVRGNAVRDDSLGTQCVRYDLEFDERNNKLFPGKVLTLDVIGFLCLDLLHPNELIGVGYSERFIKDERPAVLLMESLKPEADAFVRSLWTDWPRMTATVERVMAAAEAGYVQAQFSLGLHFQVKEQFADAAKWYRAAAEKGHAGAQNNLAVMYVEGKGGLPRDPAQAAHWFLLSAEQGAREAQYQLAGLYFSGDGVEKEVAEGMKWLRRAADQGFPIAQISLGKRCQEGDGVQWNPVRAYIWLKLGLWRATDAEERKLAEELLKKLTLALTPNQVVYAERRAAAWRPGEE